MLTTKQVLLKRGDPIRYVYFPNGGVRSVTAMMTNGDAVEIATVGTACMALHTVNERCCRWLLMTHDRVNADQFTLSHEFLAMMLGSTRPTVTLVARALQQAELIRYTHARVTIRDRKGAGSRLVRMLRDRQGRVRPARPVETDLFHSVGLRAGRFHGRIEPMPSGAEC